MTAQRLREDTQAIEAVIARQFGSLNWGANEAADWTGFASDFFPDATLYPAARPASAQTVGAFVDRMKGLSGASLRAFRQRGLGADIHTFGNVAVALAACENLENGTDATRGVEAILLIKDQGKWQIVAQAWDRESEANPIPEHLISK
jgi:hypothetical protein